MQIRIAAGETTSFTQKDCLLSATRSNAGSTRKDPDNYFLPVARNDFLTGRTPSGPGIKTSRRWRHGASRSTNRICPLLGKLIRAGADRAAAIARPPTRALAETTVHASNQRALFAVHLPDPEFGEVKFFHALACIEASATPPRASWNLPERRPGAEDSAILAASASPPGFERHPSPTAGEFVPLN